MDSVAGSLPEVGVVLLNWNNYEATARCLHSLQGSRVRGSIAVIVVDNGSTDRSLEQLRDMDWAYDRLIPNHENLGFAAGVNLGCRLVAQIGMPVICLLNNDCVVLDDGVFADAARSLGEEPDIGVLGGKILWWPDTSTIWSTGGYVTRWGGERHVGHSEVDVGQYDAPGPRDFISGAFMFLRTEVFADLGFAPEVYFFGKEEWEIGSRARKRGYRVWYCPDLTVAHEASLSHNWSDPAYVFNGTASKTLYRKRNESRLPFALWALAYALYLFPLLPVVRRLRPRRFQAQVSWDDLRRAHRAGFLHGLRCARIERADLERFRDACHG